MTDPARALAPEQLLAELTALLVQSSPDEALRRAVRWLAGLARARAAGLYLFDKSQPVAHYLHSDDRTVGAELEPHLSDLAAQAEQRGAPLNAPWSSNSTVAVRAYPLIERGRVLAVLSLGLPRLDAERDPIGERLAVGVLPLLARRIFNEREGQKAADANAQYDRWFRMLDKQMRVLERERQKFSAIVNQTDLFVLVADTNGIVRWVNRALTAGVPAGDGESSWVGRSVADLCSKLCTSAANADEHATLFARALATGGPVHEHLQATTFGEPRQLYATALPIKGADGDVDEIMVLIQDLTGLSLLRGSPEESDPRREAQKRVA